MPTAQTVEKEGGDLAYILYYDTYQNRHDNFMINYIFHCMFSSHTIGAHSLYGSIQGFSSVGREVDFLAPGEFMVLDKYPVSGTSFAAPAAAAMIALVLEYTTQKW